MKEKVCLGDQTFVTFNDTFSFGHYSELLTNLSSSLSQQSILEMKISLGNMHKLSAEGKCGYCGLSMLCDTTSFFNGLNLVIVDTINLITRSEVTAKSVVMVSDAATHGDHTDRTGIGGECRYEEKFDCVSGIASTED